MHIFSFKKIACYGICVLIIVLMLLLICQLLPSSYFNISSTNEARNNSREVNDSKTRRMITSEEKDYRRSKPRRKTIRIRLNSHIPHISDEELSGIKYRWSKIRGEMKKSEALRAKFVEKWEAQGGVRYVFLVSAPDSKEKEEWENIMKTNAPHGVDLQQNDEEYMKDARSKFFFAKQWKYRVVTLTSYIDQKQPENSHIHISERYLADPKDYNLRGDPEPEITVDIPGGLRQKIYIKDLRKDWRYCELLEYVADD